MREELEDLLRDRTLVSIVFAVAGGWSLFQVARGVAALIDGLATHVDRTGPYAEIFAGSLGGGMTWIVGHRLLAFDALVTGLVELAVVLGAALLVRRSQRPRADVTAAELPG